MAPGQGVEQVNGVVSAGSPDQRQVFGQADGQFDDAFGGAQGLLITECGIAGQAFTNAEDLATRCGLGVQRVAGLAANNSATGLSAAAAVQTALTNAEFIEAEILFQLLQHTARVIAEQAAGGTQQDANVGATDSA